MLADPLRARLVELLARESLCTCHLVEMTGATQPTVSHHLRLLREAGWVETEPSGRFTYYRLRPEALARTIATLETLLEGATTTSERRRSC